MIRETPYLPHQIKYGEMVYDTIRKYGIAYLAAAPRFGKTATMIYTAEKSAATSILVLTKKAAIKGINDELKATGATKHYTVTNYEQAAKLTTYYDFIVIDEAHAASKYPKPSQRWKDIKALIKDAPVLLMSGTPSVESKAQLFHQFRLKDYPFTHKNFYAWHAEYGVPTTVYFGGVQRQVYNVVDNDKVDKATQHLFITGTQRDAGINIEVSEKAHFIDLDARTKAICHALIEDGIVEVDGKEIVCDSDMAVRQTVYQAEGGLFGSTEKVDYIKKHFGDTEEIGIMCHYQIERELLEKHFKHASIFSSNRHKEGVNLSHLKHLIIYSHDWSGSGHLQRRERQANITRTEPITVHFIIAKDGVGEKAYDAVSMKQDFNIKMFRKLKGELYNA